MDNQDNEKMFEVFRRVFDLLHEHMDSTGVYPNELGWGVIEEARQILVGDEDE